MRHLALFLMLASICYANPKYLALRLSPEGFVEGYHGYSEGTPPEGTILIPWVDFGRQNLAPLPNKQMQARQYRVRSGHLERRPSADIDADNLQIRKNEMRRELLELRRVRQIVADAIKDGDAEKVNLDAIDAQIAAKRAELQALK